MNFFLYSWFYLQNTGKMYMYLLCLCTKNCAITQNYFKTYTGLTFSCKTNIATMYKCKPLHLHYYFQTQVNTKKSCTQLLMRKIFSIQYYNVLYSKTSTNLAEWQKRIDWTSSCQRSICQWLSGKCWSS